MWLGDRRTGSPGGFRSRRGTSPFSVQPPCYGHPVATSCIARACERGDSRSASDRALSHSSSQSWLLGGLPTSCGQICTSTPVFSLWPRVSHSSVTRSRHTAGNGSSQLTSARSRLRSRPRWRRLCHGARTSREIRRRRANRDRPPGSGLPGGREGARLSLFAAWACRRRRSGPARSDRRCAPRSLARIAPRSPRTRRRRSRCCSPHRRPAPADREQFHRPFPPRSLGTPAHCELARGARGVDARICMLAHARVGPLCPLAHSASAFPSRSRCSSSARAVQPRRCRSAPGERPLAGAGAAILIASGVGVTEFVGAAVASQVLGILVGASILLAATAWRTSLRLMPLYRPASAMGSR